MPWERVEGIKMQKELARRDEPTELDVKIDLTFVISSPKTLSAPSRHLSAQSTSPLKPSLIAENPTVCEIQKLEL